MQQWLQNLRQKSQAEKFRLFWAVIGISLVVLIILWVITAPYSSRPEKANTVLFDTLGKGIHDVKESFKNQ